MYMFLIYSHFLSIKVKAHCLIFGRLSSCTQRPIMSLFGAATVKILVKCIKSPIHFYRKCTALGLHFPHIAHCKSASTMVLQNTKHMSLIRYFW